MIGETNYRKHTTETNKVESETATDIYFIPASRRLEMSTCPKFLGISQFLS